MSTENKFRMAWLIIGVIALLNFMAFVHRNRYQVVSCNSALTCQVYDQEEHTVYWVGTGVEGLYDNPDDLGAAIQEAM